MAASPGRSRHEGRREARWPKFPNISSSAVVSAARRSAFPCEGDDGETELPPPTRPRPMPARPSRAEEVARGRGGAPMPAKRSPKTRAASPRTCSSGRASARPRSRAATPAPPHRPRRGGATRPRPRCAAPAPTTTGPGRSHPATAHRRQVGIHPADARRGAGQGARLAAPARRRVRVDPVADGVHHCLLRVR